MAKQSRRPAHEIPDNLCELQVDWYLKHGRYLRRLKRDKDGRLFVIGDWSWNQYGPEESIENRMMRDIYAALDRSKVQ